MCVWGGALGSVMCVCVFIHGSDVFSMFRS